MLLTYFLNDFEIVPVAPIITGITFFLHSNYYYYYYYHHHHHLLYAGYLYLYSCDKLCL